MDSEKIYLNNFVVLSIQEEDRQRIARELHDTSLQNLTHLIHKIELSSLYIDQDPVRAKLELTLARKILKETIDEIRNTIFNLRPMTFDDLGLAAAFERLLENINEKKVYQIEAEIEDVSSDNNLILLSIYRVVQECLSNIVKHSNAEKITFRCKCENDICKIEIADDGKGFIVQDTILRKDKHFGIDLMKERVNLIGGKITFDSIMNKGTKVVLEIPLIYKG